MRPLHPLPQWISQPLHQSGGARALPFPAPLPTIIAVDEKFCWKIDAIAERFGGEEIGLRGWRSH